MDLFLSVPDGTRDSRLLRSSFRRGFFATAGARGRAPRNGQSDVRGRRTLAHLLEGHAATCGRGPGVDPRSEGGLPG